MSIPKQDDWPELQKALDTFIKGGLRALCSGSFFTKDEYAKRPRGTLTGAFLRLLFYGRAARRSFMTSSFLSTLP